jgi:hypothetical protein
MVSACTNGSHGGGADRIMAWRGFSDDELAACADAGTGVVLTERPCPHCGDMSLRTYLYTGTRAGHPTLVTQIWCSRCERFTGSTGPMPVGLQVADPLDPHRRSTLSTAELFIELDRLWDAGELPQRPL